MAFRILAILIFVTLGKNVSGFCLVSQNTNYFVCSRQFGTSCRDPTNNCHILLPTITQTARILEIRCSKETIDVDLSKSNHESIEILQGSDSSDVETDRVFNFCILLVCFSYAVFTVVTIDSGASRGWTFQETLYR